MAADGGLAALARAWRDQQGSDTLPSGQANRTAGPLSDDGLVRPVLFEQPSEVPRNLPFAPPEPQPALSPGRLPGSPPGVRSPGGPTPQPGPALRGAARRAVPSALRQAAPGLARGALRWVGRRALGIVGLFIPDNINQRMTTDEDVAGHPDLDGRLSVAPGDRSGTVEISNTGEDGTERKLGELYMDPDGSLHEQGSNGPVLGHVDPQTRTITPTPEGEAWLQRRAGEAGITLAPPALDGSPSSRDDPAQPGTPDQPQVPPDGVPTRPGQVPAPLAPGVQPQPSTPAQPQASRSGQEPLTPSQLKELEGIETHDEEERRFIENLAMGGMKHDEIINALKELRAGRRGRVEGMAKSGLARCQPIANRPTRESLQSARGSSSPRSCQRAAAFPISRRRLGRRHSPCRGDQGKDIWTARERNG